MHVLAVSRVSEGLSNMSNLSRAILCHAQTSRTTMKSSTPPCQTVACRRTIWKQIRNVVNHRADEPSTFTNFQTFAILNWWNHGILLAPKQTWAPDEARSMTVNDRCRASAGWKTKNLRFSNLGYVGVKHAISRCDHKIASATLNIDVLVQISCRFLAYLGSLNDTSLGSHATNQLSSLAL